VFYRQDNSINKLRIAEPDKRESSARELALSAGFLLVSIVLAVNELRLKSSSHVIARDLDLRGPEITEVSLS